MRTINGRSVQPQRFGCFRPVDVLYEFDGPRIFTVNDDDGELNLACWSDEDGQATRFVVVPTLQRTIDSLRRGDISVHEALDQPRCWICDLSHAGELLHCQRVDFADIPRDAVPAPGAMLWPSLEPLITLRAIGAEITPGQIPGSAIRACIEGVQRSIKVLAEYVLEQGTTAERPKAFIRRLFDLPAQRLAFQSLEVSFRMPVEERNLFSATGDKTPEVETLEEVGELLNRGLKWLTSAAAEEGIYGTADASEAAVVLRALKELTPSSQGSIQQLELRGALIGRSQGPTVLDRESRRRVSAAIRNIQEEPRIIEFEGRIRELDRDRMSFELREIDGDVRTQRFVFDAELLEEVFRACEDEGRVKVAGQTFPVRNLAYALAISRVEVAVAVG